MIKNSITQTIASVFPSDIARVYRIPKYQRAYTWGTTEWDLLFNDILENTEGYFLGSMICVSPRDSSALSDIQALELIDGQQRTTSLSLLLLAIYKHIKSIENIELNDDQSADITAIRRMLVIKNKKTGKNEPRLCLQIQDSNQKDYNWILSDNGLLDSLEKPQNAGRRKIVKAFWRFESLINKILEESSKEDMETLGLDTSSNIDTLLSIYRKVTQALVVMIEVESHSDAFMLFESLNFRGAKLNAIDLIKNSLMAESEKDEQSDEYYEKWRTIQDRLGNEYSVQERFFRQYYNAFREELNAPFTNIETNKKYPLAYKATKSTLMDIYERLIRNDYKKLVPEINKASKIYERILNNTDEYDGSEYQKELLNLEHIQGTPSYMLLMFLENYRSKYSLNDTNMAEITKLLVSFFVRRNVTDIPSTRDLDKLFMDIIDELKTASGANVYDIIRESLLRKSAPDEEFERRLRGPLYSDSVDSTRFILCSLEAKYETKEIYVDLWERDNSGKYVWTIEHIFPEGEKIPECWVNMIANGNENLAKEYWTEYVHTIGNLTITGYNSTLSNMDFIKKRDRKKDDKYVGYKNGLFLNKDIYEKENWTKEDIVSRTENLVSMVTEQFKI